MLIRIFLIISLVLIISGFLTPNLWNFQKKCILKENYPDTCAHCESTYAYGNLGLWKAYYDNINTIPFGEIPIKYTISMTLAQIQPITTTTLSRAQKALFQTTLKSLFSPVEWNKNVESIVFVPANTNLNISATILVTGVYLASDIQNRIAVSGEKEGDFIRCLKTNENEPKYCATNKINWDKILTPDSHLTNIIVKQVKPIVIDNGFNNISTNSSEFTKNFQDIFGFKLLFSNNLFYVMKTFSILSIIAIVTTIILINKKPKLSAYMCLLGFVLAFISSVIFSNNINNGNMAFINIKTGENFPPFTIDGPDKKPYTFQNSGEGVYNNSPGYSWWFVMFGMIILFVTNMFIFQKSNKKRKRKKKRKK